MSSAELPSKRQEKVRLVADIGRHEAEVRNITTILAEQGKEAPQYRALIDKLGQVEGRRVELENQVEGLDQEVQRLERRQIDAEVIRRNLENFSLVFGKLTPERQKELVALLVQEVSYSQQDHKIKLTLRPLPDLDLRVEGHKISFDERTDWLRA